jgi:hypothetical protein
MLKHGLLFAGILCALVAPTALTQSTAHAEVNFDDLSLAPNSYWNGSDESGGFTSGGAYFVNNHNPVWGSWDGFAYSNMTDTATPGYTNQYSVYAGAAASGSNFAVAYHSAWAGRIPTITFTQELAPTSLKMTNTTYAALCIRDGDLFADAMAEGDWYKVTITARDATGGATGSPIELTLAEYPVGGSMSIVDEWLDVDLTPLGSSVKSMEFAVSSYDASTGAKAQWPDYFALDNVVAPEPATMCLLGLGGLAMLRRRGKKK